MKNYQFKGTPKQARKFAHPIPTPDTNYTEQELKAIFERNCECLRKYFKQL